jgi:hypothetical protein
VSAAQDCVRLHDRVEELEEGLGYWQASATAAETLVGEVAAALVTIANEWTIGPPIDDVENLRRVRGVAARLAEAAGLPAPRLDRCKHCSHSRVADAGGRHHSAWCTDPIRGFEPDA